MHDVAMYITIYPKGCVFLTNILGLKMCFPFLTASPHLKSWDFKHRKYISRVVTMIVNIDTNTYVRTSIVCSYYPLTRIMQGMFAMNRELYS